MSCFALSGWSLTEQYFMDDNRYSCVIIYEFYHKSPIRTVKDQTVNNVLTMLRFRVGTIAIVVTGSIGCAGRPLKTV